MGRIFLSILICLALNACAKFNKDKQPRGMGLVRTSFGPLNPQRLEPGTSLCNENIGFGIDEKLRGGLGFIFDGLRNKTGEPDQTLKNEELTQYFSFVAASGDPVIRVISRDDKSIDFWFWDDAASESQHAEKAAQAYCKSRNNRTAKYVGFSYRCGKEITVPVKINGQMTTVKEEERIVSYDCVNPVAEPDSKVQNSRRERHQKNVYKNQKRHP